MTVPSLTDAIEIDCGYHHCRALRRGGGVQSWGRPHGGELGDGIVHPLPRTYRATLRGLPHPLP